MKPSDNFCVKTHLTLRAALPVNHSNNTATAHLDSAHGSAEWKWDLCYSQQPISRPVWFFEVDCISIISGEESFYVHSSCSAGCELMSDYRAGLKANTAPAGPRLFPPQVIFCFLSYQQRWLWCATSLREMNMFGLISGPSVAESRSEGSQRRGFSVWRSPATFSIFKIKGIYKQRKNAH